MTIVVKFIYRTSGRVDTGHIGTLGTSAAILKI
jgi:hypothetical protein